MVTVTFKFKSVCIKMVREVFRQTVRLLLL